MGLGIWKMQYKSAPYLFISPFFLLFFIFIVYPFFYSIYISLTDWNGAQEKAFVGFDNYNTLFKDATFWTTLWNGVVIFFLYVPIMLITALFFAVLLNQSWMKAKGFFRTAFFAPNIISVVAISIVFVIILNKNDGLLNTVLLNMGLIQANIPWLETPLLAQMAVAFMVFYRWMGYNMLHTRIVFPNLRPAMASLGIILFVGQWNNFLWPTVILRSEDNYTISVAIRAIFSGPRTPYELVMSASVLSVIPLLIIIFLFQKQLISGLMEGSVKG